MRENRRLLKAIVDAETKTLLPSASYSLKLKWFSTMVVTIEPKNKSLFRNWCAKKSKAKCANINSASKIPLSIEIPSYSHAKKLSIKIGV